MNFSSNLVFQSFVDLFFPRSCLGCLNHLKPYERALCVVCQLDLSPTYFHKNHDNELFQELNTLFSVHAATALFSFQKEGRLAHMIHLLKYKGVKKSGIYLGNWLGITLKESPYFNAIDGIIPIPLHRKKQKKRGYNQTHIVANEMAKVLDIPIFYNALIRIKNTPSQTQAGREERWKSIQNAFQCSAEFRGKTGCFLLVDDIITSGATLTACAKALYKENAIKLSVAALGYRL